MSKPTQESIYAQIKVLTKKAADENLPPKSRYAIIGKIKKLEKLKNKISWEEFLAR